MLLTTEFGRIELSLERGAEGIQVAVLSAHEHQVPSLTTAKPIPFAHHQRHMIELVDFESVEDQLDKLLVDIVHLNDEICLVDLFTIFFLGLLKNTFLL